MIYIFYIIAVAFFCAGFAFTKLADDCRAAITLAKESTAKLADKTLSDHEKEKVAQHGAISMFRHTLFISVKLAIIFALTLAPLKFADLTGVVIWSEAIEFVMRIDVILITSILLIVVVFAANRLKPMKKT